jgi:hypothetical protein
MNNMIRNSDRHSLREKEKGYGLWIRAPRGEKKPICLTLTKRRKQEVSWLALGLNEL